MKKIGILGGLGPESTVSYYLYIIHKYQEEHKDFAYPEIIIYSLNFQKFINAGYEIPDEVKTAIGKLHDAGADFAVAACNSVHIVYDEIKNDLPIPLISIIDVTGDEIKKSGMKKVGLLGTIFTMSKGFYKKGLARMGIETILPEMDDMTTVNKIIYEELVKNEVNNESRLKVCKIIENLARKGAEGIILGCTELPFLIKQSDTTIKVFDTTAIHAQRALEIALEID
jgi:aspartate racemase